MRLMQFSHSLAKLQTVYYTSRAAQSSWGCCLMATCVKVPLSHVLQPEKSQKNNKNLLGQAPETCKGFAWTHTHTHTHVYAGCNSLLVAMKNVNTFSMRQMGRTKRTCQEREETLLGFLLACLVLPWSVLGPVAFSPALVWPGRLAKLLRWQNKIFR